MLAGSRRRQPDILEVISDLSNDEVFTPPRLKDDSRLPTAASRNNVKFHTAMIVAVLLTDTPAPEADDIASLDVTSATDEVIDKALDVVLKQRDDFMGSRDGVRSEDQVAKSADFVSMLLDAVISS